MAGPEKSTQTKLSQRFSGWLEEQRARAGLLGKEDNDAFLQGPFTDTSAFCNRSGTPADAGTVSRPPSPHPVVDLRMIDGQAVFVNLEKHANDLNSFTGNLVKDVNKIVQNIGSVHNLIQKEFQAAEGTNNFLLKDLDMIEEIMQESKRCSREGAAGPDWNESVHSRVLRFALKGNKIISCRNTTSALVNGALRLTPHTKGLTKSKLVDYSIILDPTFNDDLSSAIENLAWHQSLAYRSINQSLYHPLCYRPIIFNVVASSSEKSDSDSLVHAAIWYAAGFVHLKEMLADSRRPKFIPMPLITVSECMWWLWLVTWDEKDQMRLYGKVQIGDSESQMGIYKLLRALLRLAKWAEEVYTPWFWREILGSSDGQGEVGSE